MFIPFSVHQTKLSVLISIHSSDAGRPAKHLYGLNRVSQSPVVRPDLNPLSSPGIKRPGTVQKHLLSPDGQQIKSIPAGKDYFPLLRPTNELSDLISISSSDVGRPAKHLCGLNRAGRSSGLKGRTSTGFPGTRSNAVSRSRNSVSSPTRDPFKLRTATGSFLAEGPAPVFCGRAVGAESPNSFRSLVMWLAS